jgi:cytochrome c-type biogenesis protein CcmF
VEKRDTLKSWTILLAILAFGFSLIGAFIVRSGVLTSVHAFANDPERGVFLLIITGILHRRLADALRLAGAGDGGARASSPSSAARAGWWLNNVLLAVATFVVFVGTIWPLVAEVLTDRKLVGRPALLRHGLHALHDRARDGPAGLRSCRGSAATLAKAMRPLWGALALTLAIGALVWTLQTGGSIMAPGGRDARRLARRGRRGAARLEAPPSPQLPRADWGKAVAHAGSASPSGASPPCSPGRSRTSASRARARPSASAPTT